MSSGRVRAVARLGRPARLAAVLLDPPGGLREAARAGALGDGFGAGWWSPPEFGRAPGPQRYRRTAPLWADAGFAALAGSVDAGCLLAAVRAAEDGAPADESACPPLAVGGGALLAVDTDLAGPPPALARLVPSSGLAAVGTTAPEGFVAALVAARLGAGDPLDRALAATVVLVADRVPDARLGLLAADGRSLVAASAGRPFSLRTGEGAVLLASEPADDAPGWEPLSDRTCAVAGLEGVRVGDL